MLKTISRILRGIIHFPKTFYVNFKALPFNQARKFPIVIMGECKIVGIKRNSIIINGKIKTGQIKIGAIKSGNSGVFVQGKNKILLRNNAKLKFAGAASIGKGSVITVNKGEIDFGENFSCNVNCFFSCNTKITFGNDTLIGWNVQIRDDDGHPVYNEEHNVINPPTSVNIADHVWIASYVDILKGVSLADGIIVGYRSLVTRSVDEKNVIIAGTPAKIVKNNVYWEHN